jgi:hypothetical protein
MAFDDVGLLITSKTARVWPGSPTAFDLHEYTSLLGMAFALLHAFLLLGDRYIGYQALEVVLPFASLNYKPVAVALGQLGLYPGSWSTPLSTVRKQIGQRTWRAIHGISFVGFAFALLHGITAGTDTTAPLMILFYWLTGASVVLLSLYRCDQIALAAENSAASNTLNNSTYPSITTRTGSTSLETGAGFRRHSTPLPSRLLIYSAFREQAFIIKHMANVNPCIER